MTRHYTDPPKDWDSVETFMVIARTHEAAAALYSELIERDVALEDCNPVAGLESSFLSEGDTLKVDDQEVTCFTMNAVDDEDTVSAYDSVDDNDNIALVSIEYLEKDDDDEDEDEDEDDDA